jgi:hypothetical protein
LSAEGNAAIAEAAAVGKASEQVKADPDQPIPHIPESKGSVTEAEIAERKAADEVGAREETSFDEKASRLSAEGNAAIAEAAAVGKASELVEADPDQPIPHVSESKGSVTEAEIAERKAADEAARAKKAEAAKLEVGGLHRYLLTKSAAAPAPAAAQMQDVPMTELLPRIRLLTVLLEDEAARLPIARERWANALGGQCAGDPRAAARALLTSLLHLQEEKNKLAHQTGQLADAISRLECSAGEGQLEGRLQAEGSNGRARSPRRTRRMS